MNPPKNPTIDLVHIARHNNTNVKVYKDAINNTHNIHLFRNKRHLTKFDTTIELYNEAKAFAIGLCKA